MGEFYESVPGKIYTTGKKEGKDEQGIEGSVKRDTA